LGSIYWQQELDQNGVMNLNGALFPLLTNMTFQNAFAVINTFCLELPIFLREHNNGMYRVDAYFSAKMLAELPTFILIPTIFVGVYYFMVGFNSDFRAFLMCVLIAVLVANCASSFGYLMSCVSSSVTMALSLGPPIMIPLLLFGGFFLNNLSVPFYFVWLKYLSWFYYGNEALIINQWQGIQNISCSQNVKL
jgi:ABC-type multidrug transport system permease subunit